MCKEHAKEMFVYSKINFVSCPRTPFMCNLVGPIADAVTVQVSYNISLAIPMLFEKVALYDKTPWAQHEIVHFPTFQN